METVDYDPTTGVLRWRVSRPGVRCGDVVGAVQGDGYVRFMLDRRHVLAHRAAWALTYGTWPSLSVDHANGDPSDNRLTNLRLATPRQQAQNRKSPQGAASRLVGAVWDGERGKWLARIRHHGRTTHLGRFDTAEEARDAYLVAKLEIHDYARMDT